MFKRMILGLICAIGLTLGLGAVEYSRAKSVHAVSGDLTATFFGNASTVGTVITATTGHKLIVKEVIITAASSQTVVLQEHPATGSNTTFCQVGLLANQPYNVPPSMLQTSTDGSVTASGSSIQVLNQNAASVVVAVWVRYALN